MTRNYPLPEITPWPPEHTISQLELDEMRALFGKERQTEMLYALQEDVEGVLASKLEQKDAAAIFIATEVLCDAYSWSRRDPKLEPYCVHPYAKALLNILLKMQGAEDHAQSHRPQRGASDPKTEKQPVDLAFQIVRSAAIASKYDYTGLAQVGLAQAIEFPQYLGQTG